MTVTAFSSFRMCCNIWISRCCLPFHELLARRGCQRHWCVGAGSMLPYRSHRKDNQAVPLKCTRQDLLTTFIQKDHLRCPRDS